MKAARSGLLLIRRYAAQLTQGLWSPLDENSGARHSGHRFLNDVFRIDGRTQAASNIGQKGSVMGDKRASDLLLMTDHARFPRNTALL